MQLLLNMHDSIFAASHETVRTVRVLYFRSRTWIIERSGQQCVLHSLPTDLSALRERERDAWRVSVMSDHELLLECWWAARWQNPSSWQRPRPLWFVFAVAYRVATWLPLPPISLGYTECIHSRSVIEFHTCHSQLNCVFCKVLVYLEKCIPDMLESYRDEREDILQLLCTLSTTAAKIHLKKVTMLPNYSKLKCFCAITWIKYEYSMPSPAEPQGFLPRCLFYKTSFVPLWKGTFDLKTPTARLCDILQTALINRVNTRYQCRRWGEV